MNHVGGLAEEQGHHPDLYLAWGKVGVSHMDSQDRRSDRE